MTKLVKFAGLGRFWCCEANLRSGGPSPSKKKKALSPVNVKLIICWLALFLEYMEENLWYYHSKMLFSSTSLRSNTLSLKVKSDFMESRSF